MSALIHLDATAPSLGSGAIVVLVGVAAMLVAYPAAFDAPPPEPASVTER